MKERISLELDWRDRVLLATRLGLLQRPRGMVDVCAERAVAAVEAVPLREEVFEALRFCRRSRSDGVVRRVEGATAVAAACRERRAAGIDVRMAIRQPVRTSSGLDCGATRRVEAEEPDARPIAVTHIRAAVQLVEAGQQRQRRDAAQAQARYAKRRH